MTGRLRLFSTVLVSRPQSPTAETVAVAPRAEATPAVPGPVNAAEAVTLTEVQATQLAVVTTLAGHPASVLEIVAPAGIVADARLMVRGLDAPVMLLMVSPLTALE